MLFLLILALGLSIPTPDTLLKNTSALSETYQQKCLNKLPIGSETSASISSLLCGEKITEASFKENLMKTSLIHIFVVSGSHLILLDQVLSILRIPVFLRFLFLGFYSLAVGWQPPAVRALSGLLLRTGLKRWRFYFPGDLLVLGCGFLALILFPAWWTSMSFQMSWCAALALSMPSAVGISIRSWRGALIGQGLIFIVMMPLLWGWGSLHPLGVLCNLLLAPVVALVLLPLSLLAVLSDWAFLVFSKVLALFQMVLQFVAEPVEVPQLRAISCGVLWLWIFSLHIFLHFLRLHLRQGKDSQ